MKPQLLLLHGALGSAQSFEALEKLLAPQFEVKTLNFPGHGGEKIPQEGINPQLLVDSVNHFIAQAFKPEGVYIFGYSMGGYVALQAALGGDAQIAGIITLATKMQWSPEIAENEKRMLNPDAILEKVPQFAAELEKRHAPENWKLLMQNVADYLGILGQNNYLNSATLSALNIPVKFMIGDRDKMVSLDETTQAYKAVKSSSMAVLPNTQHPIEKADIHRLFFEITDFIRP